MSTGKSIFLVGPTASGKSAVALELAERLGGEIISVDSMQVYRGLDIGTAKPSPEERAQVPHHLIDFVNLTEPFDAAQFVRLAKKSEAEIHARERWAIFCGGTGLYFKAYLDGLGEAPPTDLALRKELEAMPIAELLQELKRRDPETYERIDQQNPRRVVRAIEVIRLTGKPFSEQRAKWTSASKGRDAQEAQSESRDAKCQIDQSFDNFGGTSRNLFGLARSSPDLKTRINARVDEMFARGIVEETRMLLGRGLEGNKTAMQALGYRQVVEHLQAKRSLAETIAVVKQRTWQFAKRQMTWFRRQMEVNWISVPSEGPDFPGRIANQIVSRTRPSG